MSVNPSGIGEQSTVINGRSARSANYTVSAADIANGWSQPIEILWVDSQGNPAPFPDTLYTATWSVWQAGVAVNAPKAIWAHAQGQILQDGSGPGGGRSQGISVTVQLLTNAKAGDVFSVHAIALHD